MTPCLITCAEADATLGETVAVMREVFGVCVEPLVFSCRNLQDRRIQTPKWNECVTISEGRES